ncbi:MAG: putative hydrolase [Rhodospirillales bacterium]|nr:putative hydrolase [Rhodospirillales bacterium]
MPIINRIAEFHADMRQWRRDIHAHPETAFEEHRTSETVATLLAEFGIAVHRGLGGTGVVGTVEGRLAGSRAIMLRADMDALHIHEKNGFAHASQHGGKMHACGHDGHTAMLLGAARYLAETRNFAGKVHLVFQPAEESQGGGRRMIEDGLFAKFPADSVFGMHNWPGLPAGEFAVRPGPMMASSDHVEIVVTGKGGHAAMPHLTVDPILAASQIVVALQTIVSRNVHPLEGAVVTVTQFHAGDSWNVIPPDVLLRGTARAFQPAVRDILEQRIQALAEGIAAAHGASAAVRYERHYPSTINSEAETALAAATLDEIVGPARVRRDMLPSMGAEDFSFMLRERPGSYVWIGNGEGDGLHHPAYDFNDEILPLGASYWARLAERLLSG